MFSLFNVLNCSSFPVAIVCAFHYASGLISAVSVSLKVFDFMSARYH